ncbi:hypothetical protein ZIOFF_040668 [Zingiber officinale]|uniref:procollagen-proline 4-dioxygenase n=1 Tax=Zingiber officinale TaxID=94328 RepID=A0A8J5KVD6_ZINOF|nr:hypothetical protein ZIOFF_040668 [Zingiber officinale]
MRSYASSIAFFFSALVLFLVSFLGLVPLAVTEPSIDDPSRVTQISWRPSELNLSWLQLVIDFAASEEKECIKNVFELCCRIFLYEGFLSDEECDHIIKLVTKKLSLSYLCEEQDEEINGGRQYIWGNSQEQRAYKLRNVSYKTSGLDRAGLDIAVLIDQVLIEQLTIVSLWSKDEVIARIDQRIAKWTFLPEENAEALQVLRYQEGQKYVPHHDYFYDPKNEIRGGHRYATVLMYLSDVKKGGETVFPIAEGASSQFKDDSWSDCAKNGLAVKPKKGDAVLFFSLHINGTTDPASLHASCPVIEREKWSAPKWIHVRSFDNPQKPSSTKECSDYNENCSYWASTGECQKNPNYMIGNGAVLGNCRKSCMVCGKSKSMRLIS